MLKKPWTTQQPMTQAVTWGPTMTVWWWWAKPCGKLSIQSTPLSCPDTLVIGHWNVRSMYRAGVTEQVARGMEGYKLDILGISECRWTGSGRQRKEEMELDRTYPEKKWTMPYCFATEKQVWCMVQPSRQHWVRGEGKAFLRLRLCFHSR